MKLKLAAALGMVYLVWGSTYLAIAVADRSLPPLLMLSVRFLSAGGIMLAWSAWRGDLRGARPSRREWGAAAAVGGLLLVVDTGGVALAEQRVPTGQAALLVATVPLFTALLDRTFFGTKLPVGAVAGIAAGLLGVGLLVGTGGRIDPLGTAVLLVAAFAWAAGSVVARVAPLPRKPFVSAALQMLCAGAMLGVRRHLRGRAVPGPARRRSRRRRSRRSASSSSSARSAPSPPSAGCSATPRFRCSPPTRTSIPPSRSPSAGW